MVKVRDVYEEKQQELREEKAMRQEMYKRDLDKQIKIESTTLTLNQKLQKQYNSTQNVEINEEVETITERLTRQGGSIAFKKVLTYKFNNVSKEMKIGDIQGYKLPEDKNLLVCKSRTNIGFTYSYFNQKTETPIGIIFIAPTGVLTEKTTTSKCLHFTPLFNTNKNKIKDKLDYLVQLLTINHFIKNENIFFNKIKNATTKKQIKVNKNYEMLDSILSFVIAVKEQKQFIMGTTPESFKKSVNILKKLHEKVGKFKEEINTKGINLFAKTNPIFSSIYDYSGSIELILDIINTLSEYIDTINYKIVYDEFHNIFNNGEYRGSNIDKFFNELKQVNEEKLINLDNIIFVSASDILPMFSSLDKSTKEYVANRWFNPLELEYIKFEFVDENEQNIYDFDGTLQTKIINIDEDNLFRHNLLGRGLNKTKSAKTVYSVSEDENTEYDIDRMNKSIKSVINVLIENDTKYSFYKEFTADCKYDYSGKVLYEMYVNHLKTQFNIMFAQMLIHGTLLSNYAFFTTYNTWKNTHISGIEFITKYADGIELMLTGYRRRVKNEWESIEDKSGLQKEHEKYTDRLEFIHNQLLKLDRIKKAIRYHSSAEHKNNDYYTKEVLELVAYYTNNGKRLSMDFIFELLPSADDVIAELKGYADDKTLDYSLKNKDCTYNFYIPAHITSNKSLNVLSNRIFSFYTDGTTAGRDFFVPKRSDKRFEEISEVVNIALQQFIDTQSSMINTNALQQCCGRLRNLPTDFDRKLIIINMVNNNFVNKFVERTIKMGGLTETEKTIALLEEIVTEQMLPIKHIATNVNTVIECVRNEVEKYDFAVETLVEHIKSLQFASFGGAKNYREYKVTKENQETVKELFDDLIYNEELSSYDKVKNIYGMYQLGAFTKDDLMTSSNDFINEFERYESLQGFVENMAKTMISSTLSKVHSKHVKNHAKNAINIINDKCNSELEINTGYQLTTAVNSMNTLAVFQGEKAFNEFVQTMLSSCKLTPVLNEDKMNIIAEHKFINNTILNTYVLQENISAKSLSERVGNEKEDDEKAEIKIIDNDKNNFGVMQYDNDTVNLAINKYAEPYKTYCNTKDIDILKGTDNMTLQIKNINNSKLYNIYKYLIVELTNTVKLRQKNIESVKHLEFRNFDSLPNYITNAEFSVLPAYMTAVFASAYGKLFREYNPSGCEFCKIQIVKSEKDKNKRLNFPHFKKVLHEVMPIYEKLFNHDEKMVNFIKENLLELTKSAIEKHKRAYVRLQKGYKSTMYVHSKIDKVNGTFNINPDFDLGVMNDELLQSMKDLCNHLIFKLKHNTVVNADELNSNDKRTTKIYEWLMRDYIVCRMYDINSTYGSTQQAIDMCPAYFAKDVLRGDVHE